MKKRNFFDDYADVNKELLEKVTQPDNTAKSTDITQTAEQVKTVEPEQIPAPVVDVSVADAVESEVKTNENE